MSEITSELYTVLKPHAFEIVSGAVKNVGIPDWQEFSHDITVDFIFFSRSYSETFERTKGDLIPFFRSYVRRKCRRIYDKQNRQRKMMNVDNLRLPSWESLAEDMYDLTQEMKSQVAYLRGRYYLGRFDKAISLQQIYLANLRSNLFEGRTDHYFIAKRLGLPYKTDTDKNRIKIAMKQMRQALRERYAYATQNLGGVV